MFKHPSPTDFKVAARVVDSDPVTCAYAACEWDELSDDGKVWIAAIVRESRASIAAYLDEEAKNPRRTRYVRHLIGVLADNVRAGLDVGEGL